MGGSSSKQVVGHKYYWGQHVVLCHGPIDKIKRIWFGEQEAWNSDVTTNERIKIDKPNLFGPWDREGGIQGDVDVLLGSDSQLVNGYLLRHCGKNIDGTRVVSAFRHLASLVFRSPYMSNMATPPPLSVECERIETGWDGEPIWYSEKANVGNGMNPAHIIHEVIECPDWGVGTNAIDDTAFRAAADTLYEEGFGLCAFWSKKEPADEFINRVCRHINADCYTDEQTGLITLRLARANYDPNDVPELSQYIIRAKNVKKMTATDLINTLTLTYTNPETYEQASVTCINTALKSSAGRTIGETVDFPMIHDPKLAYTVCMRELKQLGERLLTAELFCELEAGVYQPSDVIKVILPEAGIDHIVRVQSKRRGDVMNPEIKLTVIEDIFSPVSGDYTPPPPGDWDKPSFEPLPVQHQQAIEAPYWYLAQIFTASELELYGKDSGSILWLARQPTAVAFGAELEYKNTTNWTYSHNASFSTIYFLFGGIDEMATEIILLESLSISLPALAVVDNEIIKLTSESNGQVSIERGLLDTHPSKHSASSLVSVLDGELVNNEFTLGESVELRGLTSTPNGITNAEDATVIATEITARADSPFNVSNVKVNGEYWPDETSLPVEITWSHRNRLSQTTDIELLSDWYQDGSPEIGTVTHLKVLDQDGAVLVDEETIETTFILETLPEGSVELTIELSTSRNTRESLYKFEKTLNLLR